ncbi:MAG: hypothetical protein IPG08_16935 [Sphingobacteriaceae bacterium]|nr:hypothetical protein [Sphingobacteriaceae bacterium]
MAVGLPNTKIIVTEHSAPYREYWLENSTLIRTYQSFAQNKLAIHALAALQDFKYNPTDEFNGDYGIITRSGCIKPAYVTFRLIDKVRKIGGLIPVHSQGKIIAYSSKSNDTLRLLLSNFLETPLLAAQNKLYYKYNLNTGILSTQGYTSSTMIHNTLSGSLTPIGSPTTINAFNDAHNDYLYSANNFNNIDTLKLIFKGQVGIKFGKLIIVDSINNNNVRTYDSLKVQAAYSNSAAINHIINTQSITSHNISVTDSVYNLIIRKNSVVYIELYNVAITTNIQKPQHKDQITIYPNPSNGKFNIKVKMRK